MAFISSFQKPFPTFIALILNLLKILKFMLVRTINSEGYMLFKNGLRESFLTLVKNTLLFYVFLISS